MRHLVVILSVICAVIGDGWAQNRGSSRYAPSEDFEGDITRAPRPTRGGVRRQRPTKAPDSPIAEDELKSYEPPESAVRTTARRVPQRDTLQQVAAPPLPVDDSVPGFAVPAQGLHESSPTGPEGRPQGTRRRRPKKRRRPQNALPKEIEEPNKPATADEEKSPITDLLNEDKKRTGVFQNNPISRNSPSTYNAEPDYTPEKAPWENNYPSEQQNSAAGSPYYGPQTPSNRLPVADSEPIGNSRGYLEPSLAVPAGGAPRPQSSLPNDASYIPVLSPIRVPSEGASRLPPEDYSAIRGKETTGLSSDPNLLHRGHSNRPPVVNPDDIIRSTGAKPVHNIIPQSDDSSFPVRGHSEIRLPEDEKTPVSPQYVPHSFDSPEDLLPSNPKVSENAKETPSSSNRLPNPSEIHYDSIYPEYSETQPGGSQRIAGRRQEPEEPPVRAPVTSHSSSRRNSGTKPHEYDNDAEVDRRQVSQYRPPLQRDGSRYKTEDPEKQSRSRIQEEPPSRVVSRTRGSSRYQQPATEEIPQRTRGLTRTRTDSPVESSPRAGSSPASRSTVRTRGSQRYVPVETAPTNPKRPTDPTEKASYAPVDHEKPQLVSSAIHNQPAGSSLSDLGSIRDTLRSNPQSENHELSPASLSSLGDSGSIRNTLRSRPQYEVADSEPSDSYEESIDDPNIYNPDYQSPRQTNSRVIPNQRAPLPRQQPSQSGYQSPPNRQDTHYEPPQNPRSRQQLQNEAPQNPRSRQEPQYEAPQNPRSRQQPQYEAPQNPRSRQQPQYEAPQNPRSRPQQPQYEAPQNPRSRPQQPQYEAPQNPRGRQNPSTSRPQSRSRQPNEPSAHPRSSVGGSHFKCPDSFGFFADPVQCDKYYECRNGTAEMHLCNDGLAFNEISAPNFLRCDSLRDVDCKSRPELQEPQPTENCPRKFGLFAHETDCTKFWNCVDGTATEVQCPPGLTYNDEKATCDWADLVQTSCKSEDLLGFKCPEPTTHDLLDGVYARYPHPDNCQLHFTCIKGADGLRRPRMLSCNEGLVFDPESSACRRPEEVPGCEDFYGGRSEPPKKKPARQPARREPEPEPEEIAEEPTPRPRRRGSNRRVRY